MQPLRQGTGVQADPRKRQTEIANQLIRASGSLAILASRTIRPLASSTHTLLCSNDTSIPA